MPYQRGEEKSFEFHYRPLWDLSKQLLSNESLKNKWEWDAKIMEKLDSNGEWKRFVTEPCTADNFYKVQVGSFSCWSK